MTPRQTRFVQEYVLDLNAIQAATRAGYSAHTADVQGSPPRLLSNVKVAAAIQAGQTALSERLEVTAERVVAGLLAEAEGREDSTAGSRVAAWAHLGKYLRLFDDKTTFDGKLTIEVVRFGSDDPADEQRLLEGN